MNVIDLTKSLISCPSVTPKEAGALDLLQQELERLGFTVWREVFSEEGYEDTENLYARLGTQSPNLCFAGHTDVVPVGDASAWSVPPFNPAVVDGVLVGRGAEDMKGAIAAFVCAVEEFLVAPPLGLPHFRGTSLPLPPSGGERRFDGREAGEAVGGGLNKGSISFLITGDEEGIAINGTKKMLQWLQEKGEKIDHCIVGEPSNPGYLGEMIKVGRRGSVLFDLTVKGTQGHVAYPDLAHNPITPLVHILHDLKAQPIDAGTEFFPPSNLEITTVDVANDTSNMIPANAHARFNIRFNDTQTGKKLEAWVRSICDKQNIAYELKVFISGDAFRNHDDHLTNTLVAAVKEVTGHNPALSTTGGTSDARFIKDYCPVIEFGTTGLTAHKVNECVKTEVLEGLQQVYLSFLQKYFA